MATCSFDWYFHFSPTKFLSYAFSRKMGQLLKMLLATSKRDMVATRLPLVNSY